MFSYKKLNEKLSENHVSCKKYNEICQDHLGGCIMPHLAYRPLYYRDEEDNIVARDKNKTSCLLYNRFEEESRDLEELMEEVRALREKSIK